jgi:hypothetical protein
MFTLCTRAFLYARYSLLLISNKFFNGGVGSSAIMLLYRTGGVGGEQCGKVTLPLPHCAPTPPVRRGKRWRGIMKGGRVRGVEAAGAESEGKNQWGRCGGVESEGWMRGGGGVIRGGRVRGVNSEFPPTRPSKYGPW